MTPIKHRLALTTSLPLRYATFFYMYLMQGIPAGFALTALANYLLARGVSSSVTGTFASLVGFPWVIQFIWGPLIDRYQYSAIGHRKHWVLLSQLAAFGASLLLFLVDDPLAQIPLLTTVFVLHSIFASVQDASVDALAISVVPPAERGRLNAAMRGGFLLGIAFGTAVLSVMLNRFGFKAAVGLQSGLLLLFTVLTFFIRVAPQDPIIPRSLKALPVQLSSTKVHSVQELFRRLWSAISDGVNLRIFIAMLLVYLAFSVFIRSLDFYLIKKLGWPDERLSVFKGSWGSLVSFGVILVGGVIADYFGAERLQKIVLWSLGIFLILFNSMLLYTSGDGTIMPGMVFWSVADPLFSVAAFPILMKLCRKEVEGSQFTAYMALINFSDVAGAYTSGWALQIVPAPALGMCCGLVLVGCVLVLQKALRKHQITDQHAKPESDRLTLAR